MNQVAETPEDQEIVRAELDLTTRTIPYHDRVLVRLAQADQVVHESGIVEPDRDIKYMKEAIEGTVIRTGKRCRVLHSGDRVWLDRKTWIKGARFVIVREPDVLACEPASEETPV